MRRPSGKIPSQPLTHMWHRHHEIARRLLIGERQKDIADDMGITYARISVMANSPMMKNHVDSMSDEANKGAIDIHQRLKDLRGDAVEALREVLDKEVEPSNTSLRVRVAESILDRTGHSKDSGPSNVTVTLEQFVQGTLSKMQNGSGDRDRKVIDAV